MLKVDQISTFYGKVQALDRASIEVGENEIVSIIGANGAGKSTMMRSIMQTADKGAAFFGKQPLNA